ncbi:MAG TPA: anti-sigma factor [Gaiellaceae bacterium]|nr:anti-sigma factor [Gaiellaceae bacterium]
MKEPPDLRELIGRELPPGEYERLERVDRLLRSVPPPPHDIPASLTQAVAAVPLVRRPQRRRLGVALAFAAALAALSFAVGRWTGGDHFDAAWAVALQPTEAAPADAGAMLEVGPRDEESGNRELRIEVSGLPVLAEDEFYALWLEEDGEWAATCGYFAVGEGTTTARMTVSYDLADFDAWVITTGPRDSEPPPLLVAEIPEA